MLTRHIFSLQRNNDGKALIAGNCHMKIDRFPTELFHHLFEYFWADEILHSFSNLNDRIDSILKFYSAYRINFQSIRKSTFHLVCKQIRPEQVLSLVISDENDTIGQSELFLSYFQIEQFTNLRSLSLIHMKKESLHRFLQNLSNLKQLDSLSFDSSYRKRIFTDISSTSIENNIPIQINLPKYYPELLPRLKYFSTCYWDELTSIEFRNLRQLRLYSFTFHRVNEILYHAPQLHSLTLLLEYIRGFHQIQSCSSLRKLTLIISSKN
ncbi:unnamed protein product [Adineta ricciae]|uniref:F-box domain-containing protein n=1 Tax=Adineta ricciae TaxID=249248 RepID=A0A816EKU3_ADIRI|nr:unnamed protein product [Adineta ricciae]